MDRFKDLWEACGKMIEFYLWVTVKTVYVAIYGPVLVAVLAFMLGLIPYYFYTLFNTPSVIHLYLGLVFGGVAVYRVCFWKAKADFEVRRGREVERRQPAARRDSSVGTRTRLDRRSRSIKRGR